jgi:glycosyltransferase involved in cell wall biosynthesis
MSLRLSLIAPLPPYRGGIAQFATSSWEALAGAGHDVQAISFRRQYPGPLFPGRSQYDPQPPPTPGPVSRVLDSVGPWSWFRAASQIRAFDPDLLFFHYWMPFFAPAYGTVRRRAGRVRAISLVHNAIPHERRPLDRQLGRWFLNRNQGFIVLSEEVEQDLRRLGLFQPVRRIHHPIYDRFGEAPSREEARSILGIAPDTPLLLFFGYVREYKGLEYLLEAVTIARERLPELRLIVAGEFYESERKYREQIARLGIPHAVQIRNEFLPDTEVAQLFAACDAVVQPYVTASQSGVAQIAFHFEKAMILTDVGGLAEIVPDGEAGLVVPPADSDALGHAIERFFTERLAKHLEEGVRQRKEQFSWNRLVEAVESLAG